MTVINKSLTKIAENASVFEFGDSAYANRAKLFSTAKIAHRSRKNTRQPATAEATELAETPVHVEHSDVMLVSSQGFSKFADAKQKPQTARPKQAKGPKRHTWHSRNAATNNIPSAKCSAKCPKAPLRRMGLIFSRNETFRYLHMSCEVASYLFKVDRNTSNSTFCIFAKTSSNVGKSNVSARCCQRGVQKPRKRKDMMQNGGVVASVAAFGLEKRPRLHKDRTTCGTRQDKQELGLSV